MRLCSAPWLGILAELMRPTPLASPPRRASARRRQRRALVPGRRRPPGSGGGDDRVLARGGERTRWAADRRRRTQLVETAWEARMTRLPSRGGEPARLQHSAPAPTSPQPAARAASAADRRPCRASPHHSTRTPHAHTPLATSSGPVPVRHGAVRANQPAAAPGIPGAARFAPMRYSGWAARVGLRLGWAWAWHGRPAPTAAQGIPQEDQVRLSSLHRHQAAAPRLAGARRPAGMGRPAAAGGLPKSVRACSQAQPSCWAPGVMQWCVDAAAAGFSLV